MKRILFVFLLMIPFLSCSSDDSGSSKGKSVITAIIDGEERVYGNVEVDHYFGEDTGETYITVIASEANDPLNSISFRTWGGSESYHSFQVTEDRQSYGSRGDFELTLTKNIDKKIEGFFSGTVENNEGAFLEIERGEIHITY